MKSTALAFLGLAFLLADPAPTVAQSYPEQPVHIVVPFPPGGGTDVLTRIVGQKLSEKWGQPVVVENRPGAAGVVGSTEVSNSEADGYTLLMAATGALESWSNLAGESYQVSEHFAPIALVAAPPYLLTVTDDLDVSSVEELIAYAKENPGKLNYASSGIGAASHLAATLFKENTGIDAVHVTYNGMGEAITDLIAGRVQFMFAPPPSVAPHIESGRIRALAVTSPEPSPLFPDLPTVAASGVPGYDAVGWFGLFAPAGTPPALVSQINEAVRDVLTLPEIEERLASIGALPADTSPEEFESYINRDTDKWSELLADTGAAN